MPSTKVPQNHSVMVLSRMLYEICFPALVSLFRAGLSCVSWQRHRNRGRYFVTELISLTVIPCGEAAAFREKRTSRVVLIAFRFAGVTEPAAEMEHGFVNRETGDYDRDGGFQDVVNRVELLDSSGIARAESKSFDHDDEHTHAEETCHGDLLAESHLQVSQEVDGEDHDWRLLVYQTLLEGRDTCWRDRKIRSEKRLPQHSCLQCEMYVELYTSLVVY